MLEKNWMGIVYQDGTQYALGGGSSLGLTMHMPSDDRIVEIYSMLENGCAMSEGGMTEIPTMVMPTMTPVMPMVPTPMPTPAPMPIPIF